MSQGAIYTRPELTRADLKDFQVAKYVAVNPSRSDVFTALRVTEKFSKKNHLSAEVALQAFDEFTQGNLQSVFAGEYECPFNLKYPTQGTVLQLIRLSDKLTGLICDRQTIAPGSCSNPPLQFGEHGLLSGSEPTKCLNKVLTYFWPYLSDEELDDLHSRCAIYVMSSRVPDLKAEEAPGNEALQRRRESLEVLFQGVRPKHATAFAQQCQKMVHMLEQDSADFITWRNLQRAYPCVTSRYQANFLTLTDKGEITVRQLKRAMYQTEFNIRLTTWEGAMRLFDVPQLVIQVRNMPIHNRFAKRSVYHQVLSNEVKRQARALDHPATENTIGWLRVHMDDENKLCFIDEVQSDAMELAYELSRNSRYADASIEFIKECSGWNLLAFATVLQWAENIGYRAAIHSRESAATTGYMTDSECKWRTCYGSVVSKFLLNKESVENYPADIFVSRRVGRG